MTCESRQQPDLYFLSYYYVTVAWLGLLVFVHQPFGSPCNLIIVKSVNAKKQFCM